MRLNRDERRPTTAQRSLSHGTLATPQRPAMADSGGARPSPREGVATQSRDTRPAIQTARATYDTQHPVGTYVRNVRLEN